MKQQYEYMAKITDALPGAKGMQQFGDDGWMLVQLIPVADGWMIYFQRPKSSLMHAPAGALPQ